MIIVTGKNIIIPLSDRIIGNELDNLMETKIFQLSKTYNDIDMTGFTFKLDIELSDGTKGIAELDKEITDENILLTYTAREQDLTASGTMQIQIRGYVSDQEVWHSNIAAFEIKKSIKATDNFPPVLPSEFTVLEQKIDGIYVDIQGTEAEIIASAVIIVENAVTAAEAEISEAEENRVLAENARNVFEAYNSETEYKVNNKVSYGGSSYVNIVPCVGVLPTDTSKWLLIAQKGTDGTNGQDGIDGADGLTTSVNNILHINGNVSLDADDIPLDKAEENSSSIKEALESKLSLSGGTLTGAVVAMTSPIETTAQVRNIVTVDSDTAPEDVDVPTGTIIMVQEE